MLFFGAKGSASKPARVNHTAIYLGGGWFIQSSGNGVGVVPLEGWYQKRFAWGRRPLAEAGSRTFTRPGLVGLRSSISSPGR